tara:strand:- start:1486 stop:1707 length:222 start_codon:yes stop_codon:yes gene_type:complete
MSDYFDEWYNMECIDNVTNKEVVDKFLEYYFRILDSHSKICDAKKQTSVRVFIDGSIKNHKQKIINMIYSLSA